MCDGSASDVPEFIIPLYKQICRLLYSQPHAQWNEIQHLLREISSKNLFLANLSREYGPNGIRLCTDAPSAPPVNKKSGLFID